MTEEEEKAIERCKEVLNTNPLLGTMDFQYSDIETVLNLIQKQQEEKEKKDKIIDLMIRTYKQDDIRSIEEIKEYFTKKAEESK